MTDKLAVGVGGTFTECLEDMRKSLNGHNLSDLPKEAAVDEAIRMQKLYSEIVTERDKLREALDVAKEAFSKIIEGETIHGFSGSMGISSEALARIEEIEK